FEKTLPLRPLIRRRLAGNQLIIGELHLFSDQFRGINRFKSFHPLRLTMASLSGFVREDEQMQEAGGIALFLPRKIHLRARFTGPKVLHDLLNCLLYMVHCCRLHLIATGLKIGISEAPFLVSSLHRHGISPRQKVPSNSSSPEADTLKTLSAEALIPTRYKMSGILFSSPNNLSFPSRVQQRRSIIHSFQCGPGFLPST